MKVFAGKSPSERNKLIAAMALGAAALVALTYTFGGIFLSSKKTATTTTVTVKTSPSPGSSPSSDAATVVQPLNEAQIRQDWLTTPIFYTPSSLYASDAGRNIFAFYEPPAPTPYVPTPFVVKEVQTPTPTPAPTPPQFLAFVTPQAVYSGSKTFRLEVGGDKFTPDTKILFNQSEIPTNFVSAQKLTADIAANLIAGEGPRQIMTRTPDGKMYSNQMLLNVQAPPRPNFQYIGLLGRQSYNNDTAYLQEPNKPLPFGARLNDVVGGRFRLVSISVAEVVLQDTELGFKHRLALFRPSSGQTNNGAVRNNPDGFPNDGITVQYPQNYNPTIPNSYNPTIPNNQQEIPGIPNNIPRSSLSQPNTQRPQKKEEDDDDDGDN